MPITPAQRAQRQKFIGSSDIAAIMGFDPYRNAADVFYEKAVLKPKEDDAPPSEAAEAGNYLEDPLLRWGSDKLQVKIRRNQRRVKGYFAANIDALIVGRPEGFEAKSTGLYNPMFRAEEWGEPGTDEVPDRVLYQTHHQMYTGGLERMWVPALINGRGFQLFLVPRREEVVEQIVRVGNAFMEDHVLVKEPPTDIIPHLGTLVLLDRVPNKTVPIKNRTLVNFMERKELMKGAEKNFEEAKAALIAELGDAERGECDAGYVTYMETVQERVDSKRLKAEFPEIAAQVMKTIRFRVPREKAA